MDGRAQTSPRGEEQNGDPGLALWPEEYLHGWNRSGARLFLPVREPVPLGSRISRRIAIRGTGISATITGSVVAARRVGGPGVMPGIFLALSERGLAAAVYLERVARGLPVEWNERDPRFVVTWRVRLRGPAGGFRATTVDVSEQGCAVVWDGPAPRVGEEVAIRPSLLAPAVPARVCWARPRDGYGQVAGLRIEAEGWPGRRWRGAVRRAAARGAAPA